MSDVEFYFDYSCPWTYLAFTRLTETVARTGAEIVWRPIMVDRVRHEINPAAEKSRQDLHPSRARYQAKDLADWANFCDLSIKVPDDWPPTSYRWRFLLRYLRQHSQSFLHCRRLLCCRLQGSPLKHLPELFQVLIEFSYRFHC